MKIFLLFWFLSLGLFGLGQEPEIKEEYYECATNAMQTDDYSSAIRYLTLIIALDQQDSSAYFDRGVAREHLGDFDSAIIDYTTQISIDSENTDSYFLRGILEELNDNFSLAILDYKKVVELEFGNADAHFFLARCKEAINDTSEIIVEYSNAIEVNPEHAEAYVCRGWYYARKQDFSKALSDISKGLTINPDLSKGYYYKGWVLAKEGCYKIEDRIIDSVMQFVGYDLIDIVNDRIVKKDKRVCLDFNALAQGYSVDVVAKFFDSLNIRTYLIKIGGEVYAKGIQPNGDNWLVGIEVPEDNSNGENELHSVVILKNQALATSGNYRKFKIVDGVRYSHQLDPHTGLSTQNSLLSATVFTESCISSDAYATAFMVMGYDKTLLFLESHPEINVILIYVDENGNYKHYESEKIMNLIVPIDE